MRMCLLLLCLLLAVEGSLRRPSNAKPTDPFDGSLSPQVQDSPSLHSIQSSITSLQSKLQLIGLEVSQTKAQVEKQSKGIEQLLRLLVKTSCTDVANESTPPPRGIERQSSMEGVFAIYPPGGQVKRVKCDVSSAGDPGWTVVLSRQDGSVLFNRTLEEYILGFGDPAGEVWIGLETLHELTTAEPQQLRVEMEKFSGDTAYAVYKQFRVDRARDGFRLSVGDYLRRSTAGDALQEHNGMSFSTIDRDLDTKGTASCAQMMGGGGGWWYSSCYHALGTGQYRTLKPGQKQMPPEYGGVTWHPFLDVKQSLKTFKMMIKPAEL